MSGYGELEPRLNTMSNKKSSSLITGQQIPLKVTSVGRQTLDNYFGAAAVVAHLRRLQEQELLYLWGEPGCGKTHLLKACCQPAAGYSEKCQYLDLQEGTERQVSPQSFQDCRLLAVDNLQMIAGDKTAEQIWLEDFEQARKIGQRWVLAARKAPALSGFVLPDLVSRLESGTVYQLRQPSDVNKRLALQQRARLLGFELGDHVVNYMLLRSVRDMHALFAVLDQLDTASLVQKRKVTVHLLRELFNAGVVKK